MSRYFIHFAFNKFWGNFFLKYLKFLSFYHVRSWVSCANLKTTVTILNYTISCKWFYLQNMICLCGFILFFANIMNLSCIGLIWYIIYSVLSPLPLIYFGCKHLSIMNFFPWENPTWVCSFVSLFILVLYALRFFPPQLPINVLEKYLNETRHRLIFSDILGFSFTSADF